MPRQSILDRKVSKVCLLPVQKIERKGWPMEKILR